MPFWNLLGYGLKTPSDFSKGFCGRASIFLSGLQIPQMLYFQFAKQLKPKQNQTQWMQMTMYCKDASDLEGCKQTGASKVKEGAS